MDVDSHSKTNFLRSPKHLPDIIGGGIRVGPQYQANVEATSSLDDCNSSGVANRTGDIRVWCPTSKLTEQELNVYVQVASEYGYSEEQALGNLYMCEHNIQRAVQNLQVYFPKPLDWTDEEKQLFERALLTHHKKFELFNTCLTEKSVPELVEYYYIRKSLQKRAKYFLQSNPPSNDCVGVEEEAPIVRNEDDKVACINCSRSDDVLKPSQRGLQCAECYRHYVQTGRLRADVGARAVESQPGQTRHGPKSKPAPPRLMYLSRDELLAVLADQAHVKAEFAALERRCEAAERAARDQRRLLDAALRAPLAPPDAVAPAVARWTAVWRDLAASSPPKAATRTFVTNGTEWSAHEIRLIVSGLKAFGTNFQRIAQVVPSRSEFQIKTFYFDNRKRLALDKFVASSTADS